MKRTIRSHDGREWWEIVVEDILNEQGQPTGNYIEISKTPISISGILDNPSVYNEFIETINNWRYKTNSTFYTISVNGEAIVLTSYSLNPQYSNFALAVLGVLEQNGMLTEYELMESDDASDFWIFKLWNREKQKVISANLNVEEGVTFA